MLFSKKKKVEPGLKVGPSFKRKAVISLVFESFVRCKMNSETGRIMQPNHIYFTISKVYPEKCLV